MGARCCRRSGEAEAQAAAREAEAVQVAAVQDAEPWLYVDDGHDWRRDYWHAATELELRFPGLERLQQHPPVEQEVRVCFDDQLLFGLFDCARREAGDAQEEVREPLYEETLSLRGAVFWRGRCLRPPPPDHRGSTNPRSCGAYRGALFPQIALAPGGSANPLRDRAERSSTLRFFA